MTRWMQLTALSLGATAAMTTAQAAGPTLYGNIDLGIVHATGVPAGAQTELVSGSDFPTQIGIRGDEDLGGGLRAVYDMATGLCGAGTFSSNGTSYSLPSSGFCTGGGFMQRTSLLGVKGAFGALVAGRFVLPVYTNLAAVDPFHNGASGGVTSLDRAVSATNYLRQSELVKYTSPAWGMWRTTIVYGLGGVVGSASAGRLLNVSLNFKDGPLTAGADYLANNYVAASALAGGAIHAGSQTHNTIAQVFARYDFGVVAIDGMFQTYRSGFPISTFMPVKAASAGMNNRYWSVGASVPVGRGDVAMSYAQNSDSSVAGSTARIYAIGYDYALSKRTTLYSGLSHISNGSATAYGVTDASNSFVASPGADASGLEIGMRHSF